MKGQPVQPAGVPTFIGIDYHKAYSFYCVLDAQGSNLERGRIDHARPEDFRALLWGLLSRAFGVEGRSERERRGRVSLSRVNSSRPSSEARLRSSRAIFAAQRSGR